MYSSTSLLTIYSTYRCRRDSKLHPCWHRVIPSVLAPFVCREGTLVGAARSNESPIHHRSLVAAVSTTSKNHPNISRLRPLRRTSDSLCSVASAFRDAAFRDTSDGEQANRGDARRIEANRAEMAGK